MESSGTTGAPPRHDAVPAARQAPADGAGPQAPPEKQRGPAQDSRPRGTRWRARRGQVDTETRRIIEECYEQALTALRGSRDRLDRLDRTLLERETLEEDEAYAAAGLTPGAAPAGADHVAPASVR